MTEDYKATPEQWKLLQRQGQTLGSAESIALLELRSRVASLEAAQQLRTFTADEVAPTVAPTTRLHSYKIGEAEPVEDWCKGHTLVNPEPSLKEEALAIVTRGNQALTREEQSTIRRALEQLPDTL